ncbi:MAG: NADH-quinone oxidoreductase subunit C [Burkholderiales bacterium]
MTASRAASLRGTALAALREAFASTAEAAIVQGMVVLAVKPGDVLAIARKLRDEHGFDLLLDVTAVDWPARQPRFDVVWHFYSTAHAVRVRMKTAVAEDAPEVDSLTALYGAAGFSERECRDMYGIGFRGNADLRPILLYEGFVGHPLRKDYPKEREQPLVPYREDR